MEGALDALGMAPSSSAPHQQGAALAPNLSAPSSSALALSGRSMESARDADPEDREGGTLEGDKDKGKEVVGASGDVAAGAAEEAVEIVDRVKHPSGIVPVLQNVVATVNLGVRLDLKNIALKARNAEYNPKVR